MRFSWFVSLLFVCLAWGQAAAPPAPAAPPVKSGQPEQSASAAAPAAKPAEVAPTDPVLTLKGLCQDPSKEGASCQTVVTKEQFEKLANALQPNMAPQVRRQLATAYSKMLAMSMAAEKKGLDKGPQFEEMLGFARMQILAQILSRDMQEESQKISDDDIQKYYNDNKAGFEEANFQRIFVPKTKQAPPPAKTAAGASAAKKLTPEQQQKAGEAAMKTTAEALHKRAVAGEDFEALQKAAYVAAGIKGQAPPVKMEKVRRTSLPSTQSAVFDLKDGAISELIIDPSGYYIYKMVSKQTLPLDSVKTEIKNTMGSQRYRDSMQAVQQKGTPELNDAYFGAPRPPGMPMMPPRGGKPQQPPSEPDQD